MNKLSNYIKWVWQFPQNILALGLENIFYKNMYRAGKIEDNIIIVNNILPAGITLGDYIFVQPSTSKRIIKHECGHSKQSDILGPLYLVIIGIPSILHNIVHYLCSKIGIKWDYYKFYTEYWADKLMALV